MGQRFVACDREQSFLMPPDVRECLLGRHLAWFVIDAVAEMNLDAFYAAYRVDGRSRPAFPTRNGTAQRPDNVRSRILALVRARADELLAKDGRLPIAHMPPHTLRRTFASVLAATNVPPPRAMYLLGHTDAKLTLSVYQQVLDVGAGSIEVLEGILGCSLQEACDVLTGRVFVASSYPEPAVGERPARGPGP